MLDTAFNKRYREAGTKSQMMQAWSYVGRFVWGFAMIENTVNHLFLELTCGGGRSDHTGGIGLSAGLLLTYTLDLRKKLALIEAILKSRGVDESNTFKRVHQLHDLRNPIVHFPFDEWDGRLEWDPFFPRS
jgi:hypothetical protein